MNIIVCIKQVPDISQSVEIKINPETNTIMREGVPSIVNPFDMYAIEEGIRIKEKLGGNVTAISMGPLQAKEALKEAISMGVDAAFLISDPKFAGSDTLATSYTLATAIMKIGNFDLILCGKQAVDGDTGQVGPEVAEFLGIPVVTFVRKIAEITQKYAIVERLVERGVELVETSLPALFTVVKEINEPRLPSLSGKLRAKKTEIPVWGVKEIDVKADEVGLIGSPTCVVRIFTPDQNRGGKVFNGSVDEAVKHLVIFLSK
ncbi:MAG: electron transfer flavoprotein subunit beta/FixA family protein [bacterium]|nr:electron transfer flavoprotein subunit beta/FixA family protein [bacterium]